MHMSCDSMKPKIAIIDYGVGNIKSVAEALKKSGATPLVIRKKSEATKSDGIVLPGVGAFDSAASQITRFKDILQEKPVLGICLGMQLLFDKSEEGRLAGLGVMRGGVKRFPRNIKVPQIGWNSVKIRKNGMLMRGVRDGEYFYFANSFYARPRGESKNFVTASSSYGIDFPAVVEKGEIFGTQFHPEKSGEVGLTIIRNFVEIAKCKVRK